MKNIILSFFILGGFLSSCRKPPQKRLHDLLEAYPHLIKKDTVTYYDTIKIERVKIETILLPSTDSTQIDSILSPVKDSIQRIIVRQNIYNYIEKLRKIDTAITMQDLHLKIYTDSLGRLAILAERDARNEIHEKKIIQTGYKVEKPISHYFIFWLLLGALIVCLIFIYLTRKI